MSETVKPKRSYNSTRRREQAAATRRQIVRAAQELFEEHGYAATTMAAVADAAGVAPNTVYVAFETKSGVLRALWHLLLRGDDEDVPVAERNWYREALEEPSPDRQLRLNARNARAVKERLGNILRVIRAAAATDAEIHELWARIQVEFHANQGAIVDSLREKDALRPELDVARATDILWTLNHPDVWQLLVVERGWSPDDWEQWFGDTACAQLLRSGS